MNRIASLSSVQPVLDVAGLRVVYPPARPGHAPVVAVDDLSLRLSPGSITAIVGESGSGKTTALNALLGLLPRAANLSLRHLAFRDARGVTQSVADPRRLRGHLGLVPQDPGRAFDPLRRIGASFHELHRHLLGLRDPRESHERAIAALEAVGVDRPALRLDQFPHELSGGLRQRVLIALALVGDPALVLADEPTSNLDATVQKRVLDLFERLRAERGLAFLLVTHDIAIAAQRADNVLVMRRGRLLEAGPTRKILAAPADPYTAELLGALPARLPPRASVGHSPPPPVVLEARNLAKSFRHRGTRHAAVHDVSLQLRRGQTLAVIGESGAGKSTLLRLLTGLETPDAGHVLLDGHLDRSTRQGRQAFSRRVQLVYQNPASSLNPALAIGRIIAEPLETHRIGTPASRARRAAELLGQVELDPALLARPPGQLSGGQLQRVAIARALALEPEILVLDEPVSALDQAVQFALLTLLSSLQRRLGVAYLLVSHDLGVVRAMADEVLIMQAGLVVERGPAADLFANPRHAHTRALIEAVPAIDFSADPASSHRKELS